MEKSLKEINEGLFAKIADNALKNANEQAVSASNSSLPQVVANMSEAAKGLKSLKKAASPLPLTKVKERLVDSAISLALDKGEIEDAAFQHSILCQTFLPYRDPGDDKRLWDVKQGKARLLLKAGEVYDKPNEQWQLVGLPFGARARLILAYINTQAVKTQKSVIDVEDSLTAFIKKLGLHNEGKTVSSVKEQLRRLAAANINLAFETSPESVFQTKFEIVRSFDLWFPKDDRQKVLWTSTIQLDDKYFNSLMDHAVPLDERALASLSHNAMAMDIYAWLAQRLHRVKGVEFVAWANLKEQFGNGYDRMDNFKRVFRETLKITLTQYPDAKIEEVNNKGFNIFNSRPPILKSTFPILGLNGKN
ncbi:MAG: replication protein RepA [Saprospiraceae bacterium]